MTVSTNQDEITCPDSAASTNLLLFRGSLTAQSISAQSLSLLIEGKAALVQACYRPKGLQKVEAPRFPDSGHMKVERLLAYAPAATRFC